MLKLGCTLIFKLTGWKYVNVVPDDLRSFVFIGAPHTSNLDFIPVMAMVSHMNRNTKFIIKQEWLKGPIGALIKRTGAIGIDRKKIQQNANSNTTELMSELFQKYQDLVLMISPEGTRKPNTNWKSGFYYIASKANVPIVLGYADWKKKEAGMGKVIYPTNFEEDMKNIMNFYRNITGKHHKNFKLDERY